MTLSTGKKIAALATIGTLALGGAGAVAWAESTAPPAAATASTMAATKATAGGWRDLIRRADHGEFEIKVNGTWETVTFDRGKVAATSQGSISLARPDGQSVTLQLNATTKYHGVTGWQGIATGKGALVISRSGSATQVFQPKRTNDG